MYKLTPADYADTGQWRLLINLRNDGLEAFLENTLHPETESLPLCEAKWEKNPQKLKANIEETVYSNPRLLDDFATSIRIFEPHVIFIPKDIAESGPESEADIYRKIYPADSGDIMWGHCKDICGVWSLAPGVNSFLLRTFPGSRISVNLLEAVKDAINNPIKDHAMVNVRNDESDLVITFDGRLIVASTHPFADPEKVASLLLNSLDIYGIPLERIHVNVEGKFLSSPKWDAIRNTAASFQIQNKNENNQR